VAVKLGILGFPIGHSRSPQLFGVLADKLGVEVTYRAIPVTDTELAGELASLAADGYAGVNVTIPHKQAVLKLAQSLTPEAEAIGAVNTVRFSAGKAKGHNTDAAGFLDALDAAGFSPKGKDAVIFGAGGAARAVGWALGSAHAAKVLICARSEGKAKELSKALKKSFPKTEFSVGTARAAALWVNATPLGMDGFPDRSPAEGSQCRLAFDLVYGRETPFLHEAEVAGAKTLDGLSMLVFQALRGWEFWFEALGEARRKTLAREILKEISWA